MEDRRMSIDRCWAKLDKTQGKLNSKFNVFFDENETNVPRTVKIRVSSPDGTEAVYTLVQKKKKQ